MAKLENSYSYTVFTVFHVFHLRVKMFGGCNGQIKKTTSCHFDELNDPNRRHIVAISIYHSLNLLQLQIKREKLKKNSLSRTY